MSLYPTKGLLAAPLQWRSVFRFELQATCPETGARAGILHTAHGDVETPVFMPVGTKPSVNSADSTDSPAGPVRSSRTPVDSRFSALTHYGRSLMKACSSGRT